MFQKHIRVSHKRERPHLCDRCDKRFEFPNQLKYHYNKVHEKLFEYKIECNLCQKKFQFQSQLDRHKEMNVGKNSCVSLNKEPIECKLCSREFNFPSPYINHYQETHGSIPPEYSDKELYFCEQCPKIFLLKQHLQRYA